MLLGPQEDKSPFMAAWSTEQSCQQAQNEGGSAPGPPTHQAVLPTHPHVPPRPWHEWHHEAMTQSTH